MGLKVGFKLQYFEKGGDEEVRKIRGPEDIANALRSGKGKTATVLKKRGGKRKKENQ